jgi:hypothetical protein
LINIKAMSGKMSHFVEMKDHPHDAGHYVRKAEEYRDKARVTPDVRVKSALEAVAREFLRKAREADTTVSHRAGIH